MLRKVASLFFLIALSSILVLGVGQKNITVYGKEPVLRFFEKKPFKAVCQSEKDNFHCHAKVVTDKNNNPVNNNKPVGYGPSQFLKWYNLPGLIGTTPQTIAIVDAFDNPYAFSDLKNYSNTFGIKQLGSCPVSSGTTSAPCFQKVNQKGTTAYPRANSGWGLEISLDIQAAHAICQNCNILLVEANSASYNDLMAAVDRAGIMKAKIISNSYGSGEFASETTYDNHFSTGITYLFSSGDNGYGAGAQYPASSPNVTAVGGTTVLLNPDNTYNSEAAWTGAGSGCSAFEAKPVWQKDTLCAKRMVADISADADPNTGAAVYDTYGYRGWLQVGGTSLATPLIAGIYALGAVPSNTGASILYQSYPNGFNDVSAGSNGSCGNSYLCTALSGYDGPTGLGTPNGTSAF